MLNDVRYAFRSLKQHLGFTTVAVVTLALGIGATAAIFSVVNGVLVRPLGYHDPGRLVQLLGYRVGEGVDRGTISYPNFADWRARSGSFVAMSAYDEWAATLVGNGDPERMVGASVNATFFSILGVEPAVGRFFRDDEDAPGEARAVVLSHGLWRRRFGGDTLGGSRFRTMLLGLFAALALALGAVGSTGWSRRRWGGAPGSLASGRRSALQPTASWSWLCGRGCARCGSA